MMDGKSTSKRQWELLTSIGFLVGLTLLLFNDFLFKPWFHNAITGKLSDFAGLFIFPLFFTALWPRYKKVFFVATALFFIGWKSPLSQPLIDGWNMLGFFPIGRVVDATDLSALFMLPIAYVYAQRQLCRTINISPVIPLAIALFAFGATSQPSCRYSIDQTYQFPLSKKEVVQQVSQIDTLRSINDNRSQIDPCGYKIMCYDTNQTLPDTFDIYLPFPPNDTTYHRNDNIYKKQGKIRILFTLRQQTDTMSQLRLFNARYNKIHQHCLPDSNIQQVVHHYFEKFLVKPARKNAIENREP